MKGKYQKKMAWVYTLHDCFYTYLRANIYGLCSRELYRNITFYCLLFYSCCKTSLSPCSFTSGNNTKAYEKSLKRDQETLLCIFLNIIWHFFKFTWIRYHQSKLKNKKKVAKNGAFFQVDLFCTIYIMRI